MTTFQRIRVLDRESYDLDALLFRGRNKLESLLHLVWSEQLINKFIRRRFDWSFVGGKRSAQIEAIVVGLVWTENRPSINTGSILRIIPELGAYYSPGNSTRAESILRFRFPEDLHGRKQVHSAQKTLKYLSSGNELAATASSQNAISWCDWNIWLNCYQIEFIQLPFIWLLLVTINGYMTAGTMLIDNLWNKVTLCWIEEDPPSIEWMVQSTSHWLFCSMNFCRAS